MTLRCAGSKRIYIFGGFDGNKWLNDLHVLDVGRLEAREWACTKVIWGLKVSIQCMDIPTEMLWKGGNASWSLQVKKEKMEYIDSCSPSERVESLVQEHHKVNLPFTSYDIFATLTFWWPCRKALSTTWLYIHSSRIWAGLKGHLPRQERGLIPKLQLAMSIEVAHEHFDCFFKEQGLRGWIWLGKTLIECSSSKMLVASVSPFEGYSFYIIFHNFSIDLWWSTPLCRDDFLDYCKL